jgi:hypothetical protein
MVMSLEHQLGIVEKGDGIKVGKEFKAQFLNKRTFYRMETPSIFNKQVGLGVLKLS